MFMIVQKDLKKLIDLYSGAGNFSIPLSFQADEVLAVEQDEGLVKSGADLARKNGCRNIRFINEKAARTLKWLEKEGVSFDAVVMDPPREGAQDIAHILPRMKINKVVYISCNPSTLARDLAILIQRRIQIKECTLFRYVSPDLSYRIGFSARTIKSTPF